MDRRRFLLSLGAGALSSAAWGEAAQADVLSLAAAWRGPKEDDPQQLGVMRVDWAAKRVEVAWTVPLPSRAHGLSVEPEGTLLAVAMRPGTWLLRTDREGRVLQRLDIAAESAARRFDGHALASADGRWLYTGETDVERGEGWVSVRERDSLRRVAQWRLGAPDPHEMVLDDDGHLLLAVGGIPRGPDGRKRDLDRMASALVKLHRDSGEVLGRWTLEDSRLSLRHLVWNTPGPGQARLLGIALQAEHDDAARRAQAPVLAVWDGRTLQVPTQSAEGSGYAGDIGAAPGGGFVLSAQKVNRNLLWRPQTPERLQRVAEMTDPCALAPWAQADGAMVMAGARGVGRWHPQREAAMLPWPAPLAPDNHAIVLAPLGAAR